MGKKTSGNLSRNSATRNKPIPDATSSSVNEKKQIDFNLWLIVLGVFILVFLVLTIIPETSALIFPYFSKVIESPFISTDVGRWGLGILGSFAATLITKAATEMQKKKEYSRKEAHLEKNKVALQSGKIGDVDERDKNLSTAVSWRQKFIIACGAALVLLIVLVLILLPKSKPFEANMSGSKEATEKAISSDASVDAVVPAQSKEETVLATITLTANDAITYQNLEYAKATIEKRLQLFAGHQNCDIRFEDSNIIATTPLETFDGMNVETTVKTCISRPLRLFVVVTDGLTLLAFNEISRDMMINIEVVDENTIEAILREKDIEADAAQYFIKITLNHDGAAIVNGAVSDGAEKELPVFFAQDAQEFQTSYWGYSYFIPDQDRTVFYFADPKLKTKEAYESIAYSFLNEPLSSAFSISVKLSPEADWETIEDIQEKGARQCDIEDIQGDAILMEFTKRSDDVTEGERIDQAVNIKNRMDMIEQPYCLGNSLIDPNKIMVKTSIDRIGPDIIALLSTSSLDLKSSSGSKYDTITSWFDGISIDQDDSGYYYLRLTVDESATAALQAESKLLAEQDGKLTLCAGDSVICACDVTQIIQNGEVILDQMPFIVGQGKITQEHLFILNLIQEIINEVGYNTPFTISDYTYDSIEPTQTTVAFGIPHINPEDQQIKETLNRINSDAEMYWNPDETQTLNIVLHASATAGFIERGLAQAEQIFTECDLDNSSYSSVVFQLVEEESNQRLRLLFMDDISGTTMSCVGVCRGDVFESYYDEFATTAQKSTFYKLHNFRMLDN